LILPLVFLAGALFGALTLYTVVALAFASQTSRRRTLNLLCKRLGFERWVTFREVSADITCPKCGFSDPLGPLGPEDA
jgi:hypothetical protein